MVAKESPHLPEQNVDTQPSNEMTLNVEVHSSVMKSPLIVTAVVPSASSRRKSRGYDVLLDVERETGSHDAEPLPRF